MDKYNSVMDALIEADSGYVVAEAAQSLWMTNDHLRALHHQGHEIGLHSYSHPTRMEDFAPSLPRHLALAEGLSAVCDELFLIQELENRGHVGVFLTRDRG